MHLTEIQSGKQSHFTDIQRLKPRASGLHTYEYVTNMDLNFKEVSTCFTLASRFRRLQQYHCGSTKIGIPSQAVMGFLEVDPYFPGLFAYLKT